MGYPSGKRHSGRSRRIKKIFILTEGETEDAYFRHIKELYKDSINLKTVRRNGNSAIQLVKQMEVKLATDSRYELKGDDEAWIVFDHDGRPNSDFMILVNWRRQNSNYGLAVSNRDFEYWKLLHFHNGNGFTDYRAYHKELAGKLKIRVDDIKKQSVGETVLKNILTKQNLKWR